ncbi:hypothetical protein WICPIJ_003522 [Wickerhamomyces pijperi]|uniref:Uncharacterized protein n=1 Tax=Wickerhamomyces pijperi TaxID=599730 RepID=A0A9P8TNT2_WICPI|nr:hypothetical protein WICPIJ_003522 [Wickerhamomyces pijperi]
MPSQASRPKLNLTIQDLKFLKRQFLSHATLKINEYLPGHNESTLTPALPATTLNVSPQKSEIQMPLLIQSVEDFIDELFNTASDSMNVDGIPLGKDIKECLTTDFKEENTETFDLLLQNEVKMMYALIEHNTVKLARLKREVPLKLKRRSDILYERALHDLSSEQRLLNKQLADTMVVDFGLNYGGGALKEKEERYMELMNDALPYLTNDYENSINILKFLREVRSDTTIVNWCLL